MSQLSIKAPWRGGFGRIWEEKRSLETEAQEQRETGVRARRLAT